MGDHEDTAASATVPVTRSSQPQPEAEAGPSRPRSHSHSRSRRSSNTHDDAVPPRRPASPSNVLPSASATGSDTSALPAPRSSTPYLDLATYPTQNLLRLLASLLQQIASANDQLRPEVQEAAAAADGAGRADEGAAQNDGDGDGDGEDGRSSSQGTRSRAESRASSHANAHAPAAAPAAVHPSPTTELFNHDGDRDGEGEGADRPTAVRRQERKTSVSPTTGRPETLFSASKTSLAHHSSLLSFHARHIPSISIEAYLLRILKYCPTTNEVFLGLLVYFDRMSRLGTPAGLGGALMRAGSASASSSTPGGGAGAARGFAIDSYNVHRLVIAGVTVASKFFSDVFYTNSRYAKVGGLPPHELNQLELQFLLLNDFRLVIPADEMQRYGNRLLGYWEAREAGAGTDSAVDKDKDGGAARDGVGAPTESQVKAASDMVKFQSDSSSSAEPSTTSTATKEQSQQQQQQQGRPTGPIRQATQPTHSPRVDTAPAPSSQPQAPRRSSFDGSKATNVITTA